MARLSQSSMTERGGPGGGPDLGCGPARCVGLVEEQPQGPPGLRQVRPHPPTRLCHSPSRHPPAPSPRQKATPLRATRRAPASSVRERTGTQAK